MDMIDTFRSKELGLSNPCSLGMKRKRGGPWGGRPASRVCLDFFLKKFTCSINDEHSVVANDDLGEWALEVPPFAARFCTVIGQEHMLALANEEGDIEIVNTQVTREDSFVQKFRAHSNAVFDLKWLDKEPKLVTASGDMTAAVYDVPTSKNIAQFKGHVGSVKSVDAAPGNSCIFATGSRDGNIMTWDVRCTPRGQHHQASNTLRNVHNVESAQGLTPKQRKKKISSDSVQSVTNVVFQDDMNLFSSGAADGLIKVWDLRKNYTNHKHDPMPKHSFFIPEKNSKKHGCSNMIFDSSRMRLYASCTNNLILQYNCAGLSCNKPEARYYGLTVGTFYVQLALSPDDQYLLSGSSDRNAYIWKVSGKGAPILKLGGHAAETTAVAWCPADMFKVVTCSDDLKFRIWRASNCELNPSVIRDTAEVLKECDYTAPEMQFTTPLSNKTRKEVISSAKKITPSLLGWLQRSNSPSSSNAAKCLQVTPKSKGNKRKLSADMQHSFEERTPLSPRKMNNFANRQFAGRSLHFGDEVKREKNSTPKENENIANCEVNCSNAGDAVLVQERQRGGNNCHKPSPTTGLPNSVFEDRTSPCQVLGKRQSDCGQRLDWLTKYSKQCKKHCSSTHLPMRKSQKSAQGLKTPKKKSTS